MTIILFYAVWFEIANYNDVDFQEKNVENDYSILKALIIKSFYKKFWDENGNRGLATKPLNIQRISLEIEFSIQQKSQFTKAIPLRELIDIRECQTIGEDGARPMFLCRYEIAYCCAFPTLQRQGEAALGDQQKGSQFDDGKESLRVNKLHLLHHYITYTIGTMNRNTTSPKNMTRLSYLPIISSGSHQISRYIRSSSISSLTNYV